MNDSTEPTACARILARLLGIVQIIVLGPITLASTLTSSLLCCSCIVLKLRAGESGITWPATQQLLSTCMSSWGIFWMALLFFIPLMIALGGAAGAVIAAGMIVTYPCYACMR
jgi:ABC-type multidrug transport system permease subunit